ncbi:MAG: histidine kinase, partial [Clostridia bacterium]|nr:histidine kinase [Clostridia bacterium]
MAGKNRLPLHSLRARMIGTVILAWLVPALILTRYIMTLLPSLQELSRDSLTDSADDAWAQVSENMDSLITLSRAATYDGELLSAHTQRAQGTLSDAEFVRLSRNYLERRFAREPLCRCAIYMPDEAAGLMLYDRSGADTADAYRTLAEEAIQAMRAEMDTRCLFYPVQDHLYLARNLLDAQMRSFGLLVLEVDAARLQKPLTEVAAQWEGEQRLAIGAETENTVLPAEKLKNGAGETLVLTEASDSRDWSMIWELTIPREKVYGRVRQFRRVLIGLYLLLIPFLILIAWYIDRRFTRPISRLVDASRKIEQGEFGVTVPMKGEDELGVLGRTFSDMSTHLKELVDRTYKEEIALRDAQIQALQSRINPHFINNALEDINWQARIDGSENVSRMVSALSVLLNASMASRGKRLVTLREEMEVADAYICFIRERFGDQLILRREADKALMDCLLP